MKNRAGLLALVVLAIATIFIVFVAMPMMKNGKGPVADIANKAADTANEIAKKATDAADEVAKTVNEAASAGQTAALEKMDRLKADAGSAVTEMQALFADGKVPTAEQIAASKAKAEAALKAISAIPLPEGMDATLTATVKAANENATKWLALVQSVPADADGAKQAIAGLATAMGLSSLTDMASTTAPAAEPAKPADGTAAPATAAANTPTFDIVRVEKDGSMVVAGLGQPGSKIQIMNGETVISSTEVDKDGNFVAVLDNPLAAGDYSLVLKTTGPDGSVKTSDEVATVSVPKDASGQLLAMVTKAGEASRILTTPEAAKPAETAAAATSAPVDAAEIKLPELPTAANTIAGSAPVVDTAAATPAAETTTPAGETTKVEAAEPAKTGVPDVAVSAVELEGQKIFIAGTTKPGMLVRAYSDDKLVGEIKASATGAFVVEGKMDLAVGKHTIRTDVLDEKGTVAYRATVPFDRPEGEDVAVVASADTPAGEPAKMEMVGDGKFDQLRAEAGKALDLLKSLFGGGKVPSAEQLAAGRSSLQFALASLADFKLPENADATALNLVSKVAAGAADALKMLKDLPADPAAFGAALGGIETAVNSVVAPRSNPAATETAEASQAETPKPASSDGSSTAASAAATTPATTDAPKAAEAPKAATAEATTPAATAETAKAGAEPKTTEQAPLKESKTSVIIRQGDTLWQISRRVYGRGIRYTTIYLANQEQISNPDLIEPGQIFGVPEKSVPDEDAEAVHRKHLQEKQ